MYKLHVHHPWCTVRCYPVIQDDPPCHSLVVVVVVAVVETPYMVRVLEVR